MPRISFPVEDKTLRELNAILTWGVKCEVYRALTRMLLDAVKSHGTGVIGLLITGKYNLITKELKEEGKDVS